VDALSALVARDGYLVVALTIGLESMGLPLPGETMLITAAIYAGSTHRLHIVTLLAFAIAGAIIGDNAGYVIGRRFGYPLLLRYGHVLRIDASRIKLGEYLFKHHGGAVVFIGRFVAVLRALAALLAGINCMPWRRFLVFNAIGAIVWAAGYGLAAYTFGRELERFSGPLSWTVAAIACVSVVCAIVFVRRHEGELRARAEREFPGPLPSRRPRRDA
jgi:membrane protein DedA with SNARE-associated domain